MRPVTHDPQPRPAAGGRLVPLCPWVVTPSLEAEVDREYSGSECSDSEVITTPLYSHLGNESVHKTTFYGLAIALTKS